MKKRDLPASQKRNEEVVDKLSKTKYSFTTMEGNLLLTAEYAQTFERSIDMLDSCIKEMRRVAYNFVPEALVTFGLDIALKDFCNDVNQQGSLRVSYQSVGLADVNILPTATATAIYKIVEELINSSIKQPAATKATVQLSYKDAKISLSIQLDGKDVDTVIPDTLKAILNDKVKRGFGWSNIQHKVEALKGKIDVNATENRGTSVQIKINI